MVLDKCMAYYNIKHYRYDIKDKILVIYESMTVKKFVQLKWSLYILCKYHGLKLNDIMIKER